jgi:hypothetical protein
MEISKNEVAALQEAANKVEQLIELQDLELLMAGGGCGDISLG